MTVVTNVTYVPSYAAYKPDLVSSPQLPLSHGLSKCSLSFAMKHAPDAFVREVLSKAPITNTRKYITVDVKYHSLVQGESTCIPGWHCDGVENPLHDSDPDLYHLICFGPDESRTLFLDQSVTCQYEDGMTMYQIRECIPEDASVVEIPNNTFFSYDRFQFHSGRICDNPFDRILIRVCESDIIRPKNQIVTY